MRNEAGKRGINRRYLEKVISQVRRGEKREMILCALKVIPRWDGSCSSDRGGEKKGLIGGRECSRNQTWSIGLHL